MQSKAYFIVRKVITLTKEEAKDVNLDKVIKLMVPNAIHVGTTMSKDGQSFTATYEEILEINDIVSAAKAEKFLDNVSKL